MDDVVSHESHSFRGNNTSNGNGDLNDVEVHETGHQISNDSWLQASFVLSTSVNCAYVLGYPAAIMVPLGWYGGVIGLIVITIMSLYVSCLIAELHEHGEKRHIRYKDLAGFILGKRAYCFTWFMQYMNLFTLNTGLVLLAGSSIKSVYGLFRDDDMLKLPYCVLIAGFICALFAIGIPNLSSLGIWLGVSTVIGSVYFIVAFVLPLKDGIKNPARDYNIHGTSMGKISRAIGAIANLVFSLNTGMLPEIQATVRKPAVKNMHKALYFQFTVGNLPLYSILLVSYWAYGSSTPVYMLNAVSGPVWLKALANICTFIQTVVALHIYASPIYEYMDSRFKVTGGSDESLIFFWNRVLLRGGYMAIATFLSALMPFLGDFMSLTGAISMIPLTFVLTSLMYLAAKGDRLSPLHKLWHHLIVCCFGILAAAATIAAFRLIIVDFNTYHLFADI